MLHSHCLLPQANSQDGTCIANRQSSNPSLYRSRSLIGKRHNHVSLCRVSRWRRQGCLMPDAIAAFCRPHEIALVYAGNRLPALEIKSDRPVYRTNRVSYLSNAKDLIRRDPEVQGSRRVSGLGMTRIVPPCRAGKRYVSRLFGVGMPPSGAM